MTADRSLGAGPVKLKVSLTQEPNNLGSVRFKITLTYIGQGRSSKQINRCFQCDYSHANNLFIFTMLAWLWLYRFICSDNKDIVLLPKPFIIQLYASYSIHSLSLSLSPINRSGLPWHGSRLTHATPILRLPWAVTKPIHISHDITNGGDSVTPAIHSITVSDGQIVSTLYYPHHWLYLSAFKNQRMKKTWVTIYVHPFIIWVEEI